jgi:hypothetical protein
MNCRSSKHRKKAIFFKSVHFYSFLLKQNLDLNPDPELITDPKFQIISYPSGSGYTTLKGLQCCGF